MPSAKPNVIPKTVNVTMRIKFVDDDTVNEEELNKISASIDKLIMNKPFALELYKCLKEKLERE